MRIKKRSKRNGRSEESGELAIHFGSLDELNGLIDRLRCDVIALTAASRVAHVPRMPDQVRHDSYMLKRSSPDS